MKPKAKNFQDYFFLCKYALNLNNLTWDMVEHLPVTDSRFWTDLWAYENGDFDLANEEKNKIENLQRKNKKEG